MKIEGESMKPYRVHRVDHLQYRDGTRILARSDRERG
jgi:hypothetical protein